MPNDYRRSSEQDNGLYGNCHVYDAERRHGYEEFADICCTVQSFWGTGGGNVPIVLESNQNHATAKDTEVCPALPASMGLGGGYVPMIVAYGFDSYNQAIEEEIAQTLRSHGGGEETPKVIVYDLSGESGDL